MAWLNLATFLYSKHGPAVVACLQRAAMTTSKNLATENSCLQGGVDLILKQIDKEDVIYIKIPPDADLAYLPDHSMRKKLNLEQFISECPIRVDKISSFNLDKKAKTILHLSQTDLSYQEKPVAICEDSGSYRVTQMIAAPRNIYCNRISASSSHLGHSDGDQ